MAVFVFYQKWSVLDVTNTNELDKINQTLYLVYMGISFFFALFFFFFWLNRKENTKRQDKFLGSVVIVFSEKIVFYEKLKPSFCLGNGHFSKKNNGENEETQFYYTTNFYK